MRLEQPGGSLYDRTLEILVRRRAWFASAIELVLSSADILLLVLGAFCRQFLVTLVPKSAKSGLLSLPSEQFLVVPGVGL